MIAFIDDHRGAHGVEPICKVLPIAPSTYHSHVAKRRDPARLSARARQDAALKIEVRRVFDQNFGVYGVRRVYQRPADVPHAGIEVRHCPVQFFTRALYSSISLLCSIQNGFQVQQLSSINSMLKVSR